MLHINRHFSMLLNTVKVQYPLGFTVITVSPKMIYSHKCFSVLGLKDDSFGLDWLAKAEGSGIFLLKHGVWQLYLERMKIIRLLF